MNLRSESYPSQISSEAEIKKDELEWNFQEDGIIDLEGEWSFYWLRFLSPEDFKSDVLPKKSANILVPGSWNGTDINKEIIGGEGYATYRLIIPIEESQIGQTLGIKINYAATASKLWINGKKVSEDGKVGVSRKDMVPHYSNQVHTFIAENPIEIIVHVSNFNHKKGGLWQNLFIGTEADIFNQNNNALFYDFFLFGVLCIMTIYHFGLFILRREESTYFYFGLFCLIISIRILFTGETWISSMVPTLNWDLQIKIEYITFYISPHIFAGFLYYLYSVEFNQRIWIIVNVIGTTFVGIVIFTPPIFFTQTLPFFQVFALFCGMYFIFVLILAIKRLRIGAIAACVGMAVFFLSMIGDIIINELYGSSFLTPFGVFIFIFSQSFILSLIFSKAFQTTHSLSIHLKSTNIAYSRFVPADFITFLHRDDITQVLLGDQTKTEMSVMFCDIRSFTELSETMTPEETFKFLNAYLKRVGPIIRNNNGFIDKFMGDGIMALFPLDPEDAVLAAIQMQNAVREYNILRVHSNYRPIEIGIGIHVGSLMLGTIGEANRMDATVISDAVNLASRLEGLTKVYGAPILISDVTFQRLKNQENYQYRMLGRVQVKGKKESVGIMEIIHDTSPDNAEFKSKSRPIFERGIFYYLQKDFEAAANLFKAVVDANPTDKAAIIFQSRCEYYHKKGTEDDWDGVEIFEVK
ncbi:MAG: adenylate/guanylate cyclase domain-containing protein [Leptospiraceae bacterium]|nr:adenylate/guanylate cyclase domain-containing protein [Leptospiraceae bacterium]